VTAPESPEILYIDDLLFAVAKPSGIMVHRSGITTDRVFIADLLRERLGRRVWTVHRLDRGTSGVLLLALDRESAAALGRQFEAGTITKRNLAVVRGWLDDTGEIDRPLNTSRGRVQEARTRYRCLAQTELQVPVYPHASARYSLAEILPATGRTHQIRRHFNHIAHPVIGDVNHGDRRHNRLFRTRFGSHRLLLHAASLTFEHPGDAHPRSISADPPAGFVGVANALGWSKIERLHPGGCVKPEQEPRLVGFYPGRARNS